MGNLEEIINKITHSSIVNSIVVIFISIILYRTFSKIFTKREKQARANGNLSNKNRTYIRMTRSILRYVFIIITVLILLQINGVDVSSMLAGVGIASVIIGFAIQDVLKDTFRGFSIISDQYFHVGDVIKYKDIEGKVLAVGLKTTKIEDVRTLNTISIANRNIEQVEVVSNLINIDIPMPYETKVEDAEKAIEDILKKIKEIEVVEKCEYRGVNELADSSINYQIKVYCAPINKVQTRRDSLRCILLGLAENNIQVPYEQLDVHQK